MKMRDFDEFQRNCDEIHRNAIHRKEQLGEIINLAHASLKPLQESIQRAQETLTSVRFKQSAPAAVTSASQRKVYSKP